VVFSLIRTEIFSSGKCQELKHRDQPESDLGRSQLAEILRGNRKGLVHQALFLDLPKCRLPEVPPLLCPSTETTPFTPVGVNRSLGEKHFCYRITLANEKNDHAPERQLAKSRKQAAEHAGVNLSSNSRAPQALTVNVDCVDATYFALQPSPKYIEQSRFRLHCVTL
jgi:hypothetical protein